MSSATMFAWKSVLLYAYFRLVTCDKIAVRVYCVCVVHSVAHLLLAVLAQRSIADLWRDCCVLPDA